MKKLLVLQSEFKDIYGYYYYSAMKSMSTDNLDNPRAWRNSISSVSSAMNDSDDDNDTDNTDSNVEEDEEIIHRVARTRSDSQPAIARATNILIHNLCHKCKSIQSLKGNN